jgi:hypothetical protein
MTLMIIIVIIIIIINNNIIYAISAEKMHGSAHLRRSARPIYGYNPI